MESLCVVESKVFGQLLHGFLDLLKGVKIDVLILDALPFRSTKTLSIQRPLPPILIRIPLSVGIPVNSAQVNSLPWSVLKNPDVLYLGVASSSTSAQKSVVMLIDTRWPSTLRVAQLTMATSTGWAVDVEASVQVRVVPGVLRWPYAGIRLRRRPSSVSVSPHAAGLPSRH